MKRKLTVTIEIEYDGEGAPFPAGTLAHMDAYCTEGLTAMAEGVRGFYQMGAAAITRASVVAAKLLPIAKGLSDSSEASPEGGSGFLNGAAEKLDAAGVVTGDADAVGCGGKPVQAGTEGGEPAIKNFGETENGVGNRVFRYRHGGKEVKVGDRVMYRALGTVKKKVGTVAFMAHGEVRMDNGEHVGVECLITTITAEEEAGLFGPVPAIQSVNPR